MILYNIVVSIRPTNQHRNYYRNDARIIYTVKIVHTRIIGFQHRRLSSRYHARKRSPV
jgi:hypothetical protein